MSVEFVNADHFSKKDSQVDFDVNNLKVGVIVPILATLVPHYCLLYIKIKSVGGQLMVTHKYNGQGGSVDAIMQNCRLKQLRVLKDPNIIQDRINKMKNRGWTVTYG